MLDVSVLLEAGDWPEEDWEARARAAAGAAVRASPYPHLAERAFICELAVKLTDDAGVQALNAQYRGRDKPTNVLSFPLVQRDLLPALANTDDGEVILGDIALAYGTCAREARDMGVSLADHAMHLIVHGTLHVLGYEHEQEAEATRMERLETSILAGLGIADPYAAPAAG